MDKKWKAERARDTQTYIHTYTNKQAIKQRERVKNVGRVGRGARGGGSRRGRGVGAVGVVRV